MLPRGMQFRRGGKKEEKTGREETQKREKREKREKGLGLD